MPKHICKQKERKSRKKLKTTMKSKQAQTSGKNNFHTITTTIFLLSSISAIFVRKTFPLFATLSKPYKYTSSTIYVARSLSHKHNNINDNDNNNSIRAKKTHTTTCTQHIMIFPSISSLFAIVYSSFIIVVALFSAAATASSSVFHLFPTSFVFFSAISRLVLC